MFDIIILFTCYLTNQNLDKFQLKKFYCIMIRGRECYWQTENALAFMDICDFVLSPRADTVETHLQTPSHVCMNPLNGVAAISATVTTTLYTKLGSSVKALSCSEMMSGNNILLWSEA